MKKDASGRRMSSSWMDVGLLGILVALGSWVYQVSTASYITMETSHQMTQSLLTWQVNLTREYKKELALLKESLDQAQAALNTVYSDLNKIQMDLSNAQTENSTLRKKVALLNTVADLEGAVARLKEKNALLINHLSSMKRDSFPKVENINSFKQGRTIIAKYHDWLREVKGKIRELKHKDHLRRIAIQKEKDRIMMLAGNNGYLVRNGEISPVVIVLPVSDGDFKGVPPATEIGNKVSPANKDVKIEVTFVK